MGIVVSSVKCQSTPKIVPTDGGIFVYVKVWWQAFDVYTLSGPSAGSGIPRLT